MSQFVAGFMVEGVPVPLRNMETTGKAPSAFKHQRNVDVAWDPISCCIQPNYLIESEHQDTHRICKSLVAQGRNQKSLHFMIDALDIPPAVNDGPRLPQG